MARSKLSLMDEHLCHCCGNSYGDASICALINKMGLNSQMQIACCSRFVNRERTIVHTKGFQPTSRNFNQLSVLLHKKSKTADSDVFTHDFQIITVKRLLKKSPHKLNSTERKLIKPHLCYARSETRKSALSRSSCCSQFFSVTFRLFVPKVIVLSRAAADHLTGGSPSHRSGLHPDQVQLLSFQPGCSCRARLISGPSQHQIHFREPQPCSFPASNANG